MPIFGGVDKKKLQAEAEHYAARARVGEMNARTAAVRGQVEKQEAAAKKGRRMWRLARHFSRMAAQTPDERSNG